MLIWKKLLLSCEGIGYARAASALATQGHYEKAKSLMDYRKTDLIRKSKAIQRLEKKKKAKKEYEPGDHYFRGHKVAFWKGHADA